MPGRRHPRLPQPRRSSPLTLEPIETRLAPSVTIAAAFAQQREGSTIRVVDTDLATVAEFRAFEPAFTGGASVALGDIDGDGGPEVIAGAGDGGGPRVVLLDARTGEIRRSFYAYSPRFFGGVNVAVGDVTGDRIPDIITGAGAGGGPHVKVFDGRTGAEVASFFANAPGVRGGVSVAAGDLDGDGVSEVVTGAGDGAPHVKAFRFDGLGEVASFYAFDPSLGGGVYVGTGDTNGDGADEIVAGTKAGRTAQVAVFDGRTGNSLAQLEPFSPGYSGGATVSATDLDGDGFADVLTGAATGKPEVRAFDLRTGADPLSLSAFEGETTWGVAVAGVPPIDVTVPGVELTSSAPDPTNASFSVTATFTEAVSGFTLADVGVSNGVLGGFTRIDDRTWTFTVTPAAQGPVAVAIAEGVAEDEAGNGNAPSAPLVRTFDSVSSGITLSTGGPDPTNGAFTVTATFDKDVTGFAAANFTIGNGVGSAFTEVTPNRAWSILVTPSAPGLVTVDVTAGVTTDAAGNANTAATQLTRTFDNSSPSVALSSTSAVTVNSAFTVTATFNEDVSGFVSTDVTLGNAAISNFTPIGDNRTWTFTVTPTDPGAVTVDIAAGVATDSAGNGNTAATQLTRTYSVLPTLAGSDGTNGQRFDSSIDLLPGSVGSLGDVNGDGFEDFAIGIPRAAPNALGSGSVAVIFGKGTGWSPSAVLNPSFLNGTNGFRLDGTREYDQAGFTVAGGGDINGDGFDDILVNSTAISNDNPNGSTLFVVFGKPSGWAATQPLDSAFINGTNGFRLDGTIRDSIGLPAVNAGDVNGDGFDDILMGNRELAVNGEDSGGAYVVFGKASGWAAATTLDSAFLNGTNGFQLNGVNAFDRAGRSVAGLGDVNGDGFDDFAIGAYGVGNSAGAVYVVFGKASGWAASATLDGTTLNGTTGFRLEGVTSARISYSVAGVGDVNGDGFDDVLIGSNGTGAYVVFGKSSGWAAVETLDTTLVNGTNGFQLLGSNVADRVGLGVSSVGDVNGDGFADLLIGAYRTDSNGTDSGSAYVVFGKASGWAASAVLTGGFLDGTAGFRLDGISAGDYVGFALSDAGDVNGDGFEDFLVMGARADNGGTTGGSAYLVFGGNFTNSVTQVGDAATNTLTGTAAADALNGAQGNDTLIGNGGADVLLGGQGDDVLEISDATFALLEGGRGEDTLRLEGNLSLNIGSLSDAHRIGSIERFDLQATGTSSLTLSFRDARRLLSSSNTLTIDGGTGDSVTITGAAGSTSSISGSYLVLQLGQTTIRINLAITNINIVP